MGLRTFFLNTVKKNGARTSVDAAVSSPSFSITKVLTTGSVIVAPLATWLVNTLDENFVLQSGQVVTLFLGLLGFIAVLASADVLARAMAASGQSRADAAVTIRDSENLIPFGQPLPATLTDPDVDPDPQVQVLAATGGACGHFLIRKADGSLSWTLTSNVRIHNAQ